MPWPTHDPLWKPLVIQTGTCMDIMMVLKILNSPSSLLMNPTSQKPPLLNLFPLSLFQKSFYNLPSSPLTSLDPCLIWRFWVYPLPAQCLNLVIVFYFIAGSSPVVCLLYGNLFHKNECSTQYSDKWCICGFLPLEDIKSRIRSQKYLRRMVELFGEILSCIGWTLVHEMSGACVWRGHHLRRVGRRSGSCIWRRPHLKRAGR